MAVYQPTKKEIGLFFSLLVNMKYPGSIKNISWVFLRQLNPLNFSVFFPIQNGALTKKGAVSVNFFKIYGLSNQMLQPPLLHRLKHHFAPAVYLPSTWVYIF